MDRCFTLVNDAMDVRGMHQMQSAGHWLVSLYITSFSTGPASGSKHGRALHHRYQLVGLALSMSHFRFLWARSLLEGNEEPDDKALSKTAYNASAGGMLCK